MKSLLFSLSLFLVLNTSAQQDTTMEGKKVITLSEIVVGKDLDVSSFIRRIVDDSSFYKAFRNLRIIEFTAFNDIRMLDKKQNLKASLLSKTRQHRISGCRTMDVITEDVTGDMYDETHHFNYYTANMYASLFFTTGTVCGETNIVGNRDFSTRNKKGIDKHKEQLKILFFEPGTKMEGIPFMRKKTAIYSDKMAAAYHMEIDWEMYNNKPCYVFRQKVKDGYRNDVVIDEMTTWFDESTFEIEGRNYTLSYDAGVYDFNVRMEVKMTSFDGLTVPQLIRYAGNWKVIGKKRERGIFTATLSEFNLGK